MDMHIVDVSVIIPCFRCAATIEAAIRSVAEQTSRPRELILVDDKSDDQTLPVLRQLREKYGVDWITVLPSAVNGGPSCARNIGWEHSSGEYIAFLDSDDAWHPRKIELQYGWMTGNPDVALSGHQCLMLTPGSSMPFAAVDEHFSARRISPRRLLISNPFVTPSFMLKRDVPFRFDPTVRYAEDFFLLMRLGTSGQIIAMLDVELVQVFKEFGKSGVSANQFRMRLGDLNNYYLLRKHGQINFITMSMLMGYSALKYVGLTVMGPAMHERLNMLLNRSLRRS